MFVVLSPPKKKKKKSINVVRALPPDANRFFNRAE